MISYDICLCLTYITQYDNLWVHSHCYKWHYFVLFYGGVTFHCIYIYIHYIFFIHSSSDGQLGCFHALAIVNSSAVNIGMHVSCGIMIFSRYLATIGIAGS